MQILFANRLYAKRRVEGVAWTRLQFYLGPVARLLIDKFIAGPSFELVTRMCISSCLILAAMVSQLDQVLRGP